MNMKKWLRRIITALLIILFCIISVISLNTIIHVQGKARVINYTGIVRGATQRLIKQELNGNPNDELIFYLDDILAELSTGKGKNGLTLLPGSEYQALLAQMSKDWDVIKNEIKRTRKNNDKQYLYDLSESNFELANRAVSAAERYSETSVNEAKNTIICLCGGFAIIVCLFCLYGRKQKKIQMALAVSEHSSLAKSEFLSRMSHEIRTPLNGIIGMTEISQMHLDDRDRLEDSLKKIDLSSRYLLSLINNILDMSRIESGKIVLKNRLFDLKKLLDQIYNIFQQKAESAGIFFRVEYNSLTEFSMMGDDLRISQVLINLVSNALKFTPKDGSVSLTACQKEINEKTISLEFTVSDTGIGISEEFQTHIFEPFELEESADKLPGGTGLGLAISSNFIKMMGGTISVHSKHGEGSRFIVNITLLRPLKEENAEIEKNYESEQITYNFSDSNILLTEDNEINAEIVTAMLEENGSKVKIARNGKEAAELFEASIAGTYNMILMDIQMPVMNGLEATQTIRDMNKSDAKTIPIIGLSANAFSEDINKAIDTGMNDYLSKPIDMNKLLETVKRFL